MDSREALELTEQQEADAMPLANDIQYFLRRRGHTPTDNTNVGIAALLLVLARMLAGKNRTYVERTWGVLSASWGVASRRLM